MAYQEKKVCSSVFRAYDIRGVIDALFDEDAFYSIGRAIACRLYTLERRTIYLAKDGRLTSSSLAKALAQGLQDSGISVLDLGAVATPIMYYATCATEVDCGLMVTGSHNPADYNGIKIVLAGKTLVQEDIDGLYQLVQAGKFIDKEGSYAPYPILASYTARVIEDIVLARPLKVVVDCGNGIAGGLIPEVLRRLGCEVLALYCEVDGHFPNHHPDPTIEENLADLKALVTAEQADLGLAFDGDADRLGVVTNEGQVIWPDRLMMYYAQALLKTNAGATIVYDVKCSGHLARVIEEAKGLPIMCPSGHSIVKKVMKDSGAALAGEMSGHLFFKDRWYGFDDALYSACRLLEIISQSPSPVSEQFAKIPDSINTPEIKIAIPDKEKFLFMQILVKISEFDAARIITIDGLRVEYTDGWGLIRASNTTPCLVLRFEADNQARLVGIMQVFKEQLLKVDSSLIIPF